MKLPAAIRIGPYPCKVTRAAGDDYGAFDYHTYEISLADEAAFSSQAQEAGTLIHEMIHGVMHIYKIKVADEEALVEVLETAITQLLKDNKTLFRAILMALK